jgi:hypothetical protein
MFIIYVLNTLFNLIRKSLLEEYLPLVLTSLSLMSLDTIFSPTQGLFVVLLRFAHPFFYYYYHYTIELSSNRFQVSLMNPGILIRWLGSTSLRCSIQQNTIAISMNVRSSQRWARWSGLPHNVYISLVLTQNGF